MMKAGTKLRGLIKSGVDKAQAANLCQKDLLVAGQARLDRIVLESFQKAIDKADPGLKPVLDQLCDLYALSTLEQNKGWYLEDGYFSGSKSAAISEQVTDLSAQVRPNAVALVDAFGISEKCLAAPIAFGRTPA
jgi:acyl-CoA oxidase